MTEMCFMCKTDFRGNVGMQTVGDTTTKHGGIQLNTFVSVYLGCSCKNEDLLCENCLMEINKFDYFRFKCEEWKKKLVDKLKRHEEELLIDQNLQNTSENINVEAIKSKQYDIIQPREEGILRTYLLKQQNKQKKNNKLIENNSKVDIHIKEIDNVDNRNGETRGLPFTCTVCNKAFTQKIAMQRHITLHTGEYHHQCELCGKLYAHHSSLRSHKMSHERVRNYKCNVCEQSFINLSHLKRHTKIHTGSKEYECEICRRKFSEKYNLTVHRKIHNKQDLKEKKYTKEMSVKI